jgi:hypothetical protein
MGASASSPPSSPFKQRLNSSPEKQKVALTHKTNPMPCEKLMELYSNPKIAGYIISINPEEWYSLIDEAYDALFETNVIKIKDKIANIDALLETNQVNSVKEMTAMKQKLEQKIMGIKNDYDGEKEKSKIFVSETINDFIRTCDEHALRILYNIGDILKNGGMIPFFSMKEYKANGKVLLKGVDAKINNYYAAELAPKLNIEWSGGSKKRRHKMKYSHSRRHSSKHYSHSRRRSSKHRFNK